MRTDTIFSICLAMILIAMTGCSFLRNQEKLAKAKEAVALKKKNYTALHDAITSNSLRKGITPPAIEKLFGKPDDIFQSGSMTSHLQIWTYEKVLDPNDGEYPNPIRLYFNNHKLLNWNY